MKLMVAALVIAFCPLLTTNALAQQPVSPGWNKAGAFVCPDGYDYSATQRLCWEASQLKRLRSSQETAANVLLVITGLGAVAGVFLGLRKINREEAD